jgi:hypothetical protein
MEKFNRSECLTYDSAETGIVDSQEKLISQIGSGLFLLLDSFAYARTLADDPWEFSVEWHELQRHGMTCNDGRWLIHKGFVQHAYEITSMKDKSRRFVPCASMNLSGKTCFILTEEGYQFAREIAELRPHTGINESVDNLLRSARGPVVDSPKSNGSVALLTPNWDRDRRQLRLGATIVKEFKVPASNQEIVLAVFEEEHWPPKIDDPLPRKSDIDPQRRLHDTINSLNRRQQHRLLHFGADGLGRGIRWDYIKKHHSEEKPPP